MNVNLFMDFIETLKDVYWTFILPLICVYSIITCVINLLVFASLKSKNIIYKIMLYNSISDIAYLVSVMFVFMIRCGQFCDDLKYSYIAIVYHQYVFMYLANSLALFGIFIEILISVQRIFILTNRAYISRFKINSTLVGLLIFSFAFCIPQLFSFKIKQIEKVTKLNTTRLIYIRENMTPSMSFLFRNLFGIQQAFRLILIVFLIFTLNYLTYFLFKKHANKKRQLKANNISSKSSMYWYEFRHFLRKIQVIDFFKTNKIKKMSSRKSSLAKCFGRFFFIFHMKFREFLGFQHLKIY